MGRIQSRPKQQVEPKDKAPAAVLVSTENGRPLCFVPTRSCTLKSKVQTSHTVVDRQLGKWQHAAFSHLLTATYTDSVVTNAKQ